MKITVYHKLQSLLLERSLLFVLRVYLGVKMLKRRQRVDILSCHDLVTHRNIDLLVYLDRWHDNLHALPDPFIFEHVPELSCQI
jgi:hypothetical protein